MKKKKKTPVDEKWIESLFGTQHTHKHTRTTDKQDERKNNPLVVAGKGTKLTKTHFEYPFLFSSCIEDAWHVFKGGTHRLAFGYIEWPTQIIETPSKKVIMSKVSERNSWLQRFPAQNAKYNNIFIVSNWTYGVVGRSMFRSIFIMALFSCYLGP